MAIQALFAVISSDSWRLLIYLFVLSLQNKCHYDTYNTVTIKANHCYGAINLF